MKFAVVTGASRGLGHALAKTLLADGWTVAGMARGDMASLAGERFIACAVDLSDVAAATEALAALLTAERIGQATELCLINNAAVVTPVAPAGRMPAADIATAVALNLATVIALTNELLRLTAASPARRRVANLSSGAAHSPYAGWSVYCATKAGLDHFSRCVALEQAASANPARIAAIAPGVVDTDMQAQIRGTPAEHFPNHKHFVGLHAQGLLSSADTTAARLLKYLDSPSFGEPTVVDLRTL